MAKYYAWSVFVTEYNDYGQAKKTIQPGEEITQKDINVSKEEWDNLIAVGAVRDNHINVVEEAESTPVQVVKSETPPVDKTKETSK